jgi:hypothetical protein
MQMINLDEGRMPLLLPRSSGNGLVIVAFLRQIQLLASRQCFPSLMLPDADSSVACCLAKLRSLFRYVTCRRSLS